jgi:hypothetical protein
MEKTIIHAIRRNRMVCRLLGPIFLVGLTVLLIGMGTNPAIGDMLNYHYANPSVSENVVFTLTSEGTSPDAGGPFQGTLSHEGGSSDVWKTFCVEADGDDGGAEYFSLGTMYKVWNVDLHTATGTGNYVTDAAKWLYYQSLHDPDQLENYTADLAHDVLLQRAIWHGIWLQGDDNASQYAIQ